MLYLKISVRYLKISGLKIAVHSLKIAGLKIIARVYARGCVVAWVRGCVGAWVRGCVGAWVRSHFAEVSKIVQDAPRAGTRAPEQPRPNRNAATKATTRAGTQATTTRAPKPEHSTHPAHAYRKRNYKNNSK